MNVRKSSSLSKTELFEEIPVSRAVLLLSVPSVISSLVTVVYNLSDTYFVGLLNNPVQTAAVTLVSPVTLAFNAVNNLFGIGCSSMISRALGRKEENFACKISAFGFYCSLAFGLLFSLLCLLFQEPLLNLLGIDSSTRTATYSYLYWTVLWGAAPSILNVVLAYIVRSEGTSLHASIGTMSGCILNMILDPIFILPWGLNMGAAGAGFATFISNCAACTYFFILLFVKRKHTCIRISPKYFSMDKSIISGVCEVGIPSAIQNLLNVVSMTLLNNLAASYGADAVAAMGIAQKVNQVPLQMAFGFSQGCMPIISYNYSGKNYKRMKDSIDFAFRSLIPLMIGITVFYFIFSGNLIRMFMDNPAIIRHGTIFLRIMCLILPFLRMDFLTISVFQSLGNGRIPLFFAILRKIILEIPALIILNRLIPMYGLAFAQLVSEIVLAAAAMIMLKRLYKQLHIS